MLDVWQFSDASKMNLVVTPTHDNQDAMQHYNACMCLSRLSRDSDAVLLVNNEVTSEMNRLSVIPNIIASI